VKLAGAQMDDPEMRRCACVAACDRQGRGRRAIIFLRGLAKCLLRSFEEPDPEERPCISQVAT